MTDNPVCLDPSFSTTRLLTRKRPTLVNTPDDTFETVLFLPEGKSRKGEGGLRKKGYFKRSYDDKPLISIVTVVYNGVKYLEQTISSVLEQDYDNVEYIIIDGGSTDGTLAIIKRYEDAIDYWVSEPDKGIYDAMNKGIRLCIGDMIGMINADDYYEKNLLNLISEAYIGEFPDFIYGDLGIIGTGGKSIIPAHSTGIRHGIFPYSQMWIWVKMIFGHPSVFVSKGVYKKFGLYDDSFKVSGDYEFFIRVLNNKLNAVYDNRIFAWFRTEGISSQDDITTQRENYLARRKHSFIMAVFVELILKIINIGKPR